MPVDRKGNWIPVAKQPEVEKVPDTAIGGRTFNTALDKEAYNEEIRRKSERPGTFTPDKK